jgi:hypothetical protein
MEPAIRQVHYDGIHCHLAIEQFGGGVIVMRISGSDVGEFGDAPMLALNGWLAELDQVESFVDARDVRGASIEVSGDWAQWLARHKAQLRTVTVVTGSRFVQITAEFVRRFAELEGIMRICTEPTVFESALSQALEPHRGAAGLQ